MCCDSASESSTEASGLKTESKRGERRGKKGRRREERRKMGGGDKAEDRAKTETDVRKESYEKRQSSLFFFLLQLD